MRIEILMSGLEGLITIFPQAIAGAIFFFPQQKGAIIRGKTII